MTSLTSVAADFKSSRLAFICIPEDEMLETNVARLLATDAVLASPSRDTVLQQLYAYWLSKNLCGRLAGRQDILPEEIAGLLPFMVIYDVVREDDRVRFRVRLMGTEVVQLFGSEATGLFLDEFLIGDRADELHDLLLGVVETKLPSHGISQVHRPHRSFLQYEYVTLPLSSDGETVDMLLGARRGLIA